MTGGLRDHFRGSHARATATESRNVLQCIREMLFPLLIVSIVASLWMIGRTQELEEDIHFGIPPSPRWAAVETMMNHNAE
jgi:hypothetical protein